MRWRPTGVVLLSALGVGIFQVVGSFGAADNQPDRKAIDGIALVLVLLGPVALALRERWPVAAAAVTVAAADAYIGLGYPYGPIFVSVVVGLYAAAQSGPRRAPLLVAGAGYGGYLVAAWLDPRGEPPGLLHLALVAGWLAVVLAVAEVGRVRHDQAAERALADIKDASRSALHELRTALDLLRRGEDAPHAPQPRLADLPTLIAGVRAGGLRVRMEHEPPAQPLPAAVELAAYRIVQEALTNVTRHARAQEAIIRVGYADGMTIEVLDDGVGGLADAGNGISGMRERAAALGGTLTAGARPEGGFRLAAHLPVTSS